MNKEEQIKLGCDQLIGYGNLGVVSEVFSSDYIAHAGVKKYEGHNFIKRFTRQVRTAIPDVKVIKVEFLARTDNMVIWQRMLRGTHRSGLMGIPPSGKKVEWTDMVVSRFEGKKIIEEWVVTELAGKLLLKLPATK